MDRPAGPRQPPDKRNVAYESIFGRPGALHHSAQNSAYYSQNHYPQHYPHADRRNSYASTTPSFQGSYQPQPHWQQQPNPYYQQQQGYHGSTYPSMQYPQQIPGSYGHPSSSNASAHPTSARGPRSSIGVPAAEGLYSSGDESSDNNRDPRYAGLTPAQAYQAQVYSNSHTAGPQSDPNLHRQHMHAGPSSSRPTSNHLHNGNSNGSRTLDVPRLGVSLDHDDGRLNIDFGVGSNNSDGGHGTDESAELPWTRGDHPPTLSINPPTPYAQSSVHPAPHADVVSLRSSSVTSSPSTTDHSRTLVDHSTPSRRSSESAQTMPKSTLSISRRDRGATAERAMSMSAASSSSIRTLLDQNGTHRRSSASSRPPIPSSVHDHSSGGRSSSMRTKKSPSVYPAMLSRVADAFKDRIPLGDRLKDGLTYKDAFDGREAVDKIAYIIKTTDRNLALLLGRALDAQKFFHDVTYDHRLRDSANELYQFRTKLPSPFVSGDMGDGSGDSPETQDHKEFPLNGLSPAEDGLSSPQSTRPRKGSITSDDVPLPTGVFTLLTDCYSPTCSRDQLCYSIACPRRLEQQSRLNMKPQPGLSKQISRESLGDAAEPGTLWIHSVPQEIVNSVSDTEKKRQEAINEVIYTERDFVRDLEYLRDTWIGRLKDTDIVPPARRRDFLTQVFWNVDEIIAVNTKLRDALNKRQKSYAVVERIGDIFLENVPSFTPFVTYGAHQLYGKYEFEKEKTSNPSFLQFVETTERLPESRKLELNAYLTKPTTRLARYPLLLEAVLKHTPEDSPDKVVLPKVVAMVRVFLGKVNEESGKTENRFNLMQLESQLTFRNGEEVNLRLSEEGRQLVAKDSWNKRDGEIQVYLFDHAIVFTKPVKTKTHDQFKVYRRPIPLELLLVSAPEDANVIASRQRERHRQLTKRNSFQKERGIPLPVAPPMNNRPDTKGQNWISFTHLGRKYYNLVLFAPSPVVHKRWLDLITKQQQTLRDRSMIFDAVTLSDGFFFGPNKVNCAAPYNHGRRIVYGTNDGVYISDLHNANKEPAKVLALLDVMQVDVLEDYQLLIVLSERQVITFPLDALDEHDPTAGLKRAKRISSHTSFFKAGFCLGRVLVCIVKSSQLSSTFKTLEPIDSNVRGRAKPTFKKLLQGGNDTLKLFREFYIPVESTSIHYLKTKMCVGCSRGFEIVDLESLDTQGLLDPNDDSLDFVRRRENLRPMAIYRIHNEFLLCYDEFAFYVNKNGRRSRKEFMVHWEGTPTGFGKRLSRSSGLGSSSSNLTKQPSMNHTPPSVTNTISPTSYGPGYGYQSAYNQPQGYGGYGGYSSHQQYPHQFPPNTTPQGIGRDEILIVSDDRVLTLRPTAEAQRYISDNTSLSSFQR